MKAILNRLQTSAFSLVEIVIAIGIFAFCITAIISLLAMALESSRNSQRDSAMTAILQNTVSQMAALPVTTLTNLPTTNFFYDIVGSPSASTNDQFYRATVNRVASATVSSLTRVTNTSASVPVISPGITNVNNHFLWVVQIAYPTPTYPQTNSFIFGRTLMGSVNATNDIFRE